MRVEVIIEYSVKTVMKSDKNTNISELKEKVAGFIHECEWCFFLVSVFVNVFMGVVGWFFAYIFRRRSSSFLDMLFLYCLL